MWKIPYTRRLPLRLNEAISSIWKGYRHLTFDRRTSIENRRVSAFISTSSAFAHFIATQILISSSISRSDPSSLELTHFSSLG